MGDGLGADQVPLVSPKALGRIFQRQHRPVAAAHLFQQQQGQGHYARRRRRPGDEIAARVVMPAGQGFIRRDADQHDHRKVVRLAVSHDPVYTVQGHLDPECSRRRVQPPLPEQGLCGDGAVFRDLLSWRLKYHHGAARRDGDDALLADLQGLVEAFRPHGFHDRHDDAGEAAVRCGFTGMVIGTVLQAPENRLGTATPISILFSPAEWVRK